MKFLRLFLTFFLWVLALIAVLTVLAISPIVQTWVARFALSRQPELHASLGSLSARFGKVRITDLHLEFGGTSLTVPLVQASLPVTSSIWERKVPVQRLVIKDWKIDLSRKTALVETQEQSSANAKGNKEPKASPQVGNFAVQTCLQVFHGLLRDMKLPFDLALSDVELEGDVVLAAAQDSLPGNIHVVIKGGGLSIDRHDSLSFDATGQLFDSKRQMTYISAHGSLILAMDTPRTMKQAAFKGDVLIKNDTLLQPFTGQVNAEVARGATEESYTLVIDSENRHLADVKARVPAATACLTGTWKLNLLDTDLAPFVASGILPALSITGDGEMDTDVAFTQLHAAGKLSGTVKNLGVLSESLTPITALPFDSRFDVVLLGKTLHFDRLRLSLGGAEPVAVLQALKPFDLDTITGRFSSAAPQGDWFQASIHQAPLPWLSWILGNLSLEGPGLSGELIAGNSDKGFSLRSTVPLSVKGVTVKRAGKLLGQNLDLSLALLAERNAAGWQLQGSPLIIENAGQRLLHFDGKLVLPEKRDLPRSLSGNWSADLKALATQSAIPGTGWITAQSSSGEFTATFGPSTKVAGKFSVNGPTANQTISSTFDAEIYTDREVHINAPIKFTDGKNTSELLVVGTWYGDRVVNHLAAMLTSKDISLENLRQLVPPLAAMGGVSQASLNLDGKAEAHPPLEAKDSLPFWGNWIANLTVSFDRLKTGGEEWKAVRWIFNVEPGSISLDNSTYELPDRSLAMWKGSVNFDPAAAIPYTLKASAELGEVDAEPLFGKPLAGKDPVFRGRFSVAGAFKGKGINLSDLIQHTDQEFKLSSKGGIIRLLRANVGEAIPEKPSTTGSEILGTMGDAVGAIFGTQKPSVAARRIHPSTNTEAVLNFTYDVAEFRYDLFTFTATRGIDQNVRLSDIAITGPEVHMTGAGQITYTKGLSLFESPLSLDLQFGFRGRMAGFLTTAALLSSQKDDQGYTTMVKQPLHFGGSLLHLEKDQWLNLLIKAAEPKPEEPKKAKTN